MNTHRLTVMVMIRVASFIFHSRATAVFKHYSVNTARNVYENHKSHILSLVALIRTMFFFLDAICCCFFYPSSFTVFGNYRLEQYNFTHLLSVHCPLSFFFFFSRSPWLVFHNRHSTRPGMDQLQLK